ncbi:EF-hand domain-containing protein [bacterium]|nr:EF-hand domain-containing protein [bacterium]
MEKWVPFTLVALGASLLLPDQGAQANPVRHYGTRMEALFVRMDSNRDGRLERREVSGQPYLERRLQRHTTRNYLLIEDIRPSASHQSGLRLQRRFQQADRNFDGKLDRKEVASLPWLQRNFESLDRNGDGGLTLNELWMMQRSLAPRSR